MKKLVLAALVGVLATAPVLAQDVATGDPQAGETLFKRCASCHAIGENAKNRVGPYLTGVYGRVAGSGPDYNYSNAMKEHGATGAVWNDAELSAFLENPKGHVPGTKMAFPGLKKPEERANVIAYLKTFSPDAAQGAAAGAPATGAAAPATAPAAAPAQ